MYTGKMTYSISNEMLTGSIGATYFSIKAASGGRRGRAYDRQALSGLLTWSPGMKLPSILGSVGKDSLSKKAVNNTKDSRVVQSLLNIYGRKLIVDGIVGNKTIGAIEIFQKSIGLFPVDGRIDPKGRTFKGLLRDVAGGPLPPGKYKMVYQKSHRVFGKCIYLEPIQIEEMIPGITEFKKRNGFFVHGRGDRGSDGCIVPFDPSQRKKLNSAIAMSPSDVELVVRDPWAPPHLVNEMLRLARTG